jgi:hypothetical protein
MVAVAAKTFNVVNIREIPRIAPRQQRQEKVGEHLFIVNPPLFPSIGF